MNNDKKKQKKKKTDNNEPGLTKEAAAHKAIKNKEKEENSCRLPRAEPCHREKDVSHPRQ